MNWICWHYVHFLFTSRHDVSSQLELNNRFYWLSHATNGVPAWHRIFTDLFIFFTQLYPGCIFSCLSSTLDSIHHSNFRLEDFKKECDLYYLLQTWIGGINKFEKKENCATIIKSDKIADLRHLQKCIYTKCLQI